MLSFVFLYTHWVCNLAIKQMAYYSLSSYGISRQVKEQILYKGSPVCMQSIVKYINICGALGNSSVFILALVLNLELLCFFTVSLRSLKCLD